MRAHIRHGASCTAAAAAAATHLSTCRSESVRPVPTRQKEHHFGCCGISPPAVRAIVLAPLLPPVLVPSSSPSRNSETYVGEGGGEGRGRGGGELGGGGQQRWHALCILCLCSAGLKGGGHSCVHAAYERKAVENSGR